MKNIKNINMIISTLCLIMMMIFVGTAAILSSHNKIGDSDQSYSTITTTKTTPATTTTTTSTTTTTTTSTTPTTTTTSTTTKTPTTTTTKTTPATTTTTTSTTTIATETAAPESEFVEVTYQELETTNVVETTEAVDYEEPATEEDSDDYYNYSSYASVCDTVTYYGNYGHEVSGASGNTLISGYSCACDLYPFGTILYVETSDGAFSGYLRVDDRVSDEMNTTIVDIYYYSYDMAPYNMQDAGKYTTYYIDDWHPTCIINVVG